MEVVGAPVSAVDAVGAVVLGVVIVVVGAVVVSCSFDRPGGATGALLVGGVAVVVIVVAGSAGGAPCASWMMPQTITAIRAAMRMPHPTSAMGVRQPGTGCGDSAS